jgi:hypothetical protein
MAVNELMALIAAPRAEFVWRLDAHAGIASNTVVRQHRVLAAA